MQSEEPRPRYAHQLVYDDHNRVHYMLGGNPGGKQGKEDKLRLGDFWRLHLQRPDRAEVLRRCRILIRQCKFSELAGRDPMIALGYLHSSLASVVDHKNPREERQVFKSFDGQAFTAIHFGPIITFQVLRMNVFSKNNFKIQQFPATYALCVKNEQNFKLLFFICSINF
jgi:hypothetical protein